MIVSVSSVFSFAGQNLDNNSTLGQKESSLILLHLLFDQIIMRTGTLSNRAVRGPALKC